MYDYIKGIFTYKNAVSKSFIATVETGGIGYMFEIMKRDYDLLVDENKELKMFCALLHKEDKMSLCGFLKREDRDMFNILTSVSGVGVKMALTLLDSFPVTELVGFVLDEDYKSLTNAKGVGQKLAQKIIIELKGKLNSYKDLDIKPNSTFNKKFKGENVEDAQMVLTSLGYDSAEINSALEHALKTLTPASSAEEILKKSLQLLSI